MSLVTEVTLLTDIKNDIGEVQINPTQYTILERLKQIEANTSGGGGGGATPIYFEQSFLYTSTVGTTYLVDDNFNDTGLTSPKSLDLSSITGVANKFIQLDSIQIMQDIRGELNSLFPFTIVLNNKIIPLLSYTDKDSFIPLFSDWNGSQILITFNESVALNMTYAGTGTCFFEYGIKLATSPVNNRENLNWNRIIKLDSNSKIYLNLVMNGSLFYDVEQYRINIKGHILP